jgi:hypothetical protein
MTRGFLRLLMILVLAMAMPLKGVASVTMLGCLLHPAAQGAAESVHSATAHGHSANPEHHHSESTAGTVSDAHAGHLVLAGSHTDANSKCGTCAPCCAGAALIGSSSTAVSDQPGDADFPASASLHPSGRNTRLDRPPRHLAA